LENIFKISSNFSITPGFRFEKIRTQAEGSYRKINLDLAGNVILDENQQENNVKDRNFVLFGVGLSYKPQNQIELYGNVSQNYRSVTFNDIRTVSPSNIDPNISDEKFTSDIGIRGQLGDKVTLTPVYGLYIMTKLGSMKLVTNGSAAVVRYRSNIGTAVTYGFETMFDWNLNRTFLNKRKLYLECLL
jgi:Fe(3+) dicitrate transport protein